MSDAEANIPSVTVDQPMYCANHPHVETRLRCNKCGKPICTKCAIRTPVGFRCPQCLHEQQAVFYTATPLDYGIAVIVALALAVVAGAIMSHLGWFFAIFLGPVIGGLIAEVVRQATRRRRGRWIPLVVLICIVAGAVIPLVPAFLSLSAILPALSPSDFWNVILSTFLSRVNIVYVVLAAISAYARLR
jgi:MFS family permease